ncbi:MAG: YIP1 family protein [Methanoregula sp.]|nr:YIP1 family protein [Methanoregula sp.]
MNLVTPIIIVGLACLFKTVPYLVILVTALAYPVNPPITIAVLIVFLILLFIWIFLEGFFSWGICSVLFYFLGRTPDSGGSFRITLQNTGYGLLPATLLKLPVAGAWIIVAWYHFFYLGLQGPVSAEYLSLINTGGLILGLAGLLWSGYLWTFGLVYALRIPSRKALLMVTIMVVLLALFTIWPVLSPLKDMRMIP